MSRYKKAALFAGTTEGRRLVEGLHGTKTVIDAFVATEYGKTVLPESPELTVHVGRLTEDEMKAQFMRGGYDWILDATHPFAVEASHNIQAAAKAADIPYRRILRDEREDAGIDGGKIVFVESVQEAADFLSRTDGRILVTTGSKELTCFLAIPDWKNRVYARVLSTLESVALCAELGILGDHLIAMQGPFSKEMNLALLRQTRASWLVTKESGQNGGYGEKLAAAAEAGVGVVVVGRPSETGVSVETALEELGAGRKPESEEPEKPANPENPEKSESRILYLIGAGPGDLRLLTGEAADALCGCDVIAGSARLVKNLESFGKPLLAAYQPDVVLSHLNAHPEYKRAAVVFSGDVGFYSGAGRMLKAAAGLHEFQVKLLCGVSSVNYFFAKTGKSWENVKFVSLHGKKANVAETVKRNRSVFVLLGDEDAGRDLCETLLAAGLYDVKLTFGENLTSADERFYTGTPTSLKEKKCAVLSVVLIENLEADKQVATHGLPDEAFLRGEIPMTKQEVRSVSISKLYLTPEAVVYDIGAGTGSVAVECARLSENSRVFAVEKNPEAVRLIQSNQEKFGVQNLEIIEGMAPEALFALPSPTHVFIGGSGGKLDAIIRAVLAKNPRVRIVINVIALETLAAVMQFLKTVQTENLEIVQLFAARDKKAGALHLMTGQNPVYVISFNGSGQEAENWQK